ncbi:MAG TPA: amylo-alpha-1,6-glucosidase, partial [Verrucomicrobiae bacterium]|nr:amylo-alpha-1,6-glucosidase [Verrucomicrobiae bacterium]
MTPPPGERFQRFVGDCIRFSLKNPDPAAARNWQARLRTNIGRADILRGEILQAHTKSLPIAGASWRDLPMEPDGDGWSLELPLCEVGFFKAKAYLLDENGWQHWPEGADVGISVHPNSYRTANTIYCAFTRLFGPAKSAVSTRNEKLETQIQEIEGYGFSIIPASGKLRDLIEQLPHIVDNLGCRILQLLPINPTPTTYARFGRFGSPYAALDLTAIDPALVVFDKRTTGIDQFRELTYAAHLRGARVFLDIVINHTGWGSTLQENRPEWFLRRPDGTFVSPGAWGVTWEDLVELKHINVALWDQLAEMFLTWCRRGVDGFRCDAGYKVPVAAWQYIVARVEQEYPETIFFLEGLGGSWEATEALLGEGGMQWAYSELFQNYTGRDVAAYLDYALRQSSRVGLYVHFSETHDNNRLAAQSFSEKSSETPGPNRAWSLMRNQLCALASVSGGFGFTCGVEWLATEKINVHRRGGLSWDNKENLLPELSRLNRLLAENPCFFDGAILTRLSAPDSPVFALLRQSAEGKDFALVLVNTDLKHEQAITLENQISIRREENSSFCPPEQIAEFDLKLQISNFKFDLLGQSIPEFEIANQKEISIRIPPAAAFCLAPNLEPVGLAGEDYRRARAQAAWAVKALHRFFSASRLRICDWRGLAELVEKSPFRFLAAIRHLDPSDAKTNLISALDSQSNNESYPNVIRWSLIDRRRITPVPPNHWILIEDTAPFRASLRLNGGAHPKNVESISVQAGHIACFPPGLNFGDAELLLERYAENERHVQAAIRFLAPEPKPLPAILNPPPADSLVLLANGIGGMARFCVDLGRVRSKYDCVLGANLHPSLPVDRHIFAKRIRVWVNADGFISPLDLKNLSSFEPGPPAIWRFIANAGDGRSVGIEIKADMLEGRNTTVFHFLRPGAIQPMEKPLPPEADVRLTVRVDIEDRNFHSQTQRNGGADFHFTSNIHPLETENSKPKTQNSPGFAFTPAPDRQLRVIASEGAYHSQPEWTENIPHPVEQSRGQIGAGDAFSPGWFELPLSPGANLNLVITADPVVPKFSQTENFKLEIEHEETGFESQLFRAAEAFVVRRGNGKTVIAGYPWFLDWGRDTFICARGLLTAGMTEEVKQILLTFARFEKNGTLPNTIFGEDASNRDTSDAPLWFGLVCEELEKISHSARENRDSIYKTTVDDSGRTLLDVLRSIATNYISGTPNGIRMDADSALIWSPSHFTWMDTNYPAASAREGYPIEIQALWIRFLRQLAGIDQTSERGRWKELETRAAASFEKFFWLEEKGFYADALLAAPNQSASASIASDALRPNCLIAVSLGVAKGTRARHCVEAAARYLVVPGAVRSL